MTKYKHKCDHCNNYFHYKHFRVDKGICRQCNINKNSLTCEFCCKTAPKSHFNKLRVDRGEIVCWDCNKKMYRSGSNKRYDIEIAKKPVNIVPKLNLTLKKEPKPEKTYTDRFGYKVEVWRIDKWRKHLEQAG